MSWFDRFTSRKGKEKKSIGPTALSTAKKLTAAEQEKKAFAAVPTGKPSKAPATKQTAEPTATAKETTDRADRILLRPVITEKATMLGKQQQYIFSVAPAATKVDVRQAVQHVYGIRPTAVTITNLPGKAVRYGRTTGRTVARKKAVVTLPPGKTIDLTIG